MNSDILKRNFIKWVENRSSNPFPSHPLLLAVLDDNSELFINSTIDEVPFIEYYPEPQIYQELFRYWKGSCLGFLKASRQDSRVSLNFRGVSANLHPDEVKQQLLIIDQLNSVCSDE